MRKIREKDRLKKEDIQFLCSKTGLNEYNLQSLIEEKRDLDLILEQIAYKTERAELKGLSPRIFNKISVFKFTDSQTNYEDKSYVSGILTETIPCLMAGIDFKKLLKEKASEKVSRFSLVLAGISDGSLNIDRKKIRDGFLKSGNRNVAYDLVKWIEVIGKMKINGWLVY